MFASAFNLYIDDFPQTGDLLVHNGFSGAFVVLDCDQAAVLARWRTGEPLPADALAMVREYHWSEPDIGIVVESREQEESEYRAWFDEQRAGRELQAIVCTNLSCNFECTYCCQAEVMSGSVMTPEVIARTADWLAERAMAIDAERVQIVAVGGEPLLYPGRIKALVARMLSQVERHGIEVALGIITNGYFLTDDMVRELLPYGLVYAQVTLDGDQSTHCMSRPSKRGEDTFQVVFDNVIAASRHIHLSLNGNYQEHTVAGFAPLIHALERAGLAREHHLGFAPAFEMLDAPKGSVSGACDWGAAPHAYRVALHDRIVEAGYRTTRLYAAGPCGFHSHHLFAVGPKGDLYKCPGFLGHPEWRIGHVAEGLGKRYQDMLDWDVFSACGDCAHRPNCGGSCVADEFLRTGDMRAKCERAYLDGVYKHAVPRDYLLVASDDIEQAVASFPAPPVALPAPAGQQSARGARSAALRIL